MKKIFIFILIISILVLIFYVNFWPIIDFKNKIKQTNNIQIYLLESDGYVFQKEINDTDIINEFIDVFLNIKIESRVSMTPIPKYKLVFLNDNYKIVEIECLQGIKIKEIPFNLTINIENHNKLENLIIENVDN